MDADRGPDDWSIGGEPGIFCNHVLAAARLWLCFDPNALVNFVLPFRGDGISCDT